jgi:hypothetical protein
MKNQNKFPAGWDEARVRRVLEHYESQTDEEAVAEDEASFEATTHTAMEVPVDLVPAVRELIAKPSSSPALEPTAASGLRTLAVPSSPRSSAAAQAQR